MKLSDILYEADVDAQRDMADAKYIDAEGIDTFSVDLELYDEYDGENIMKGSPKTIEIDVETIINDVPEYLIASDSEIVEFLEKENAKKKNANTPYYLDDFQYEFEIDFESRKGVVKLSVTKDDTDVGQK